MMDQGRVLLVVLLVSLMFSMGSTSREFLDDRGVRVVWPPATSAANDEKKQPTIVANANGALALFHMGMTSDQLSAVWDKWLVRGSNLDWNNVEQGSFLAGDPDADDVAFLESVPIDLTPSCSHSSSGCRADVVLDTEQLRSANADFAVYIHPGPFSGVTGPLEDVLGAENIIYIDTNYQNKDDNSGYCRSMDFAVPDHSRCTTRTVLDIIRRIEELADFLIGDNTIDDPTSNNQTSTSISPRRERVLQDAQQFCETAHDTSLFAQELHRREVRCMGMTVWIAQDDRSGTIDILNFRQSPWLRTAHALGLPLLGPGEMRSPDTDLTRTIFPDVFFPDCAAFGTIFCQDYTPMYPMDCMLLATPAYARIETEYDRFEALLPMPPIQQRHYTPISLQDGAFSYKTAIAVFQEWMRDLAHVQKVYPSTQCRDDVDWEQLEGGEYACYDRGAILSSDMMTCPIETYEAANEISVDDTDKTATTATASSSKRARHVVGGGTTVVAMGVVSLLLSDCWYH